MNLSSFLQRLPAARVLCKTKDSLVAVGRLSEDESRKSLTIEKIVSGLEPRSMPTSLMVFTIPEVFTYSDTGAPWWISTR
jgi:hypothetical protein